MLSFPHCTLGLRQLICLVLTWPPGIRLIKHISDITVLVFNAKILFLSLSKHLRIINLNLKPFISTFPSTTYTQNFQY